MFLLLTFIYQQNLQNTLHFTNLQQSFLKFVHWCITIFSNPLHFAMPLLTQASVNKGREPKVNNCNDLKQLMAGANVTGGPTSSSVVYLLVH